MRYTTQQVGTLSPLTVFNHHSPPGHKLIYVIRVTFQSSYQPWMSMSLDAHYHALFTYIQLLPHGNTYKVLWANSFCIAIELETTSLTRGPGLYLPVRHQQRPRSCTTATRRALTQAYQAIIAQCNTPTHSYRAPMLVLALRRRCM